MKTAAGTNRLPAKEFENIANRAPGMVDVYHYRTGQYVYCNYAIRNMLGYEPEEMFQGGLAFFISHIHPEDRPATTKLNASASKAVEQRGPKTDDSKPFASFEYRVRHKDGHWVWLRTEAGVFGRTADGQLEYVVNTCVDITEQKLTEAKLQQVAEDLVASQAALRADHEKLIEVNIAKDEFVSIASHQLRTPATGVKQFLGLLLAGYAGEVPDSQLNFLQAAYECNERQLATISDLLLTTRLESGKLQLHKIPSDLVLLIQQIVDEQMGNYQSRKQGISFTFGGRPVIASIDETLIRMVIENLLDNASKYSPDGKGIEINLSVNGDTVLMDVIDHGVVIPKAEQDKLFRKFSRIENAGTAKIGGTGLGLYWAKKVVDLHGGSIRLKSSNKTRTVFSVTLPV